ncbi:hypothetical protein HDU79_000459 [Rhizoclosmatium sp. JEL0117]|nr:hypothetical protein HDU79_000459 [Rhizoclosmatium sp. JEL0117]
MVLASFHQLQGRYAQAEKILLECIEDTVHYSEHHLNANFILGQVYLEQGILTLDCQQLEKADAILENSFWISTGQFGADHPDTLIKMNSLVRLYAILQKNQEALRKTIEASQKFFGDFHPDVIAKMISFSLLISKLDEVNVKKMASQCNEIIVRNNYVHKIAEDSFENLALVFDYVEEIEAEGYFTARMDYLKSIQGGIYTFLAEKNLADKYVKYKKYDEAEVLYCHLLETCERGSRLRLDSIASLAILYDLKGDFNRSETLLIQCLELNEKYFGDAHNKTMEARKNLATFYFRNERYNESNILFSRWLDTRTRVLNVTQQELEDLVG